MNNGYAICLNEWIFDTRIKNELNLLLYISSLTAEKGFCFATNEHFAQMFFEHEGSISRKINKLVACGYISVQYIKRGCEVKERHIRLTNLLIDGSQNCQSTVNKNVKDNITSINNININNIYMSEFEKFWKTYPKQRAGSKEKAYKSYCKAIKEKKITVEKLQEVCALYAQSDEVKRGYAKGCAAWLNDERYNTEYKTKSLKAPTYPPEQTTTEWWRE